MSVHCGAVMLPVIWENDFSLCSHYYLGRPSGQVARDLENARKALATAHARITRLEREYAEALEKERERYG
jgi:hypothetical protein